MRDKENNLVFYKETEENRNQYRQKIAVNIVSLQPRLKHEHSHLPSSSLTMPGNCWVVMAHLKQISSKI
jgi:hypothetical protein